MHGIKLETATIHQEISSKLVKNCKKLDERCIFWKKALAFYLPCSFPTCIASIDADDDNMTETMMHNKFQISVHSMQIPGRQLQHCLMLLHSFSSFVAACC